MLPEELIQKVKKIEIKTRKMVNDVLTGEYRSQFKGQGIQFSEHRVYSPGDDVRHIDWKASARSKEPLLKQFIEEREVSVLLVVDVSGSSFFGSSEKLKSEVIAEIAGMLAYAATHTGDKVGAILFAGGIEKMIPLKKGRHHVLRIIRDLLEFRPKTKGTHLSEALDSAGRLLKHSSVVFVLSDFVADDFDVPIKRLSRKHDVIAIKIVDQKEESATGHGLFLVVDPETNEKFYLNTDSYDFKNWMKSFKDDYQKTSYKTLKESKVELLEIKTQEDYGEAVVRYFHKRNKKINN